MYRDYKVNETAKKITKEKKTSYKQQEGVDTWRGNDVSLKYELLVNRELFCCR